MSGEGHESMRGIAFRQFSKQGGTARILNPRPLTRLYNAPGDGDFSWIVGVLLGSEEKIVRPARGQYWWCFSCKAKTTPESSGKNQGPVCPICKKTVSIQGEPIPNALGWGSEIPRDNKGP